MAVVVEQCSTTLFNMQYTVNKSVQVTILQESSHGTTIAEHCLRLLFHYFKKAENYV